MGKFKIWIAKQFFKDMIPPQSIRTNIPETTDATSSGSREVISGLVKKLGLRFGDVANSKDYEEPEFDLVAIREGCNIDAYLRQGVDKYVDQIFKEGYQFYGKDENIVTYIKQRFDFMAEATDQPTGIFLVEIAEDIVKYSNTILAKSRSNDPNVFPPGVTVQGLNGKDPIAGYFAINPTTTKVRRDKNGTIKGWQQEVDGADKPVKFNPEDVVHIYYKREKGNAYGTPFLLPVLNDIRSLREAEDSVLKMLHKNIYPFLHAKIGDDKKPGSTKEVDSAKSELEDMDAEGGVVTSNRVSIEAVETNKVINAEPYLRYMEDRSFSGMGIPGILFGRGGTANRSTGDNMSNEMSDRVRAMRTVIETFINFKIIKELLMEGGYDPILNPDQLVEFRFNDNDIDTMIKKETHAIFKYEHNSIDENEMRNLLGLDPIVDRSFMHQVLITQANAEVQASFKPAPASGGASGSSSSKSSSKSSSGSKATNNKQKPTNQHGTKTSPKKTTNSYENLLYNLDDFKDNILNSIAIKDIDSIKQASLIQASLMEKEYSDRELVVEVKEQILRFILLIGDELASENDIEITMTISEVLVDNLLDNIKFIISSKEENHV